MKSAFNAKVASTEFSVKLVENALTLVRSRLNFQRLNAEQRLNSTHSNHLNPRTNSKRHLSSSRHFPSGHFSSQHIGSPLNRPLSCKPSQAIQQLKQPLTSPIVSSPIAYRHLTTTEMDLNNNKENFARILWRSADCVCFDVDSTVCRDEAIDELARFAGKEKQVQEL